MIVVYRDDLGHVAVEVDTRYCVGFLDCEVYFDDLDGNSYRVPIDQLIMITTKEGV